MKSEKKATANEGVTIPVVNLVTASPGGGTKAEYRAWAKLTGLRNVTFAQWQKRTQEADKIFAELDETFADFEKNLH